MTEIKFGTDGWRAVIADSFTFENVKIVTRAIGKFVKDNYQDNAPLVIGYDPRFLAKEFAKTCAQELINLGINVQLSDDIVPTPLVAFWAAKSGKTSGAIQFTASHNPPEYCGLKYITNYGGPAPEEITNSITKIIKEQRAGEPESRRVGGLTYFNPKEQYIKHLKKLINFNQIKNANLKIIYDPMFGAGNNYLDFILKEAGCKTITIHNKLDPLFGGLLPEPKEDFLKDLKTSVVSNKANIGLATDGDADRIAAVDENGIFYPANKIGCMLFRHLYKNKNLRGAVVRTLSTTHLIDHLAKKYNLEVIETKVGFKWICKEMIEKNVLIGIEESGGISILNHIPDKDAILAGMLIVEMLAYEKKPLTEIYKATLQDANWSYINDKLDLHISDEEKKSLISILSSEEVKEFGGLKILSKNKTEGIKCLLEGGGWLMARASGTEPMARVYFEATSEKKLDAIKKDLKKIVEASCQK